MKYEYVNTKEYIERYSRVLEQAKRSCIDLNRRARGRSPDPFLQDDLGRFFLRLYTAPGVSFAVGRDSQQESPVSGVIDALKRDGVSQKQLADWCSKSEALVNKWKNSTSIPGKYCWWKLAIHIGLEERLLDAFLMMIGCSFDPLCRQDQILFHTQYTRQSTAYLYTLLKDCNCLTPEMKELFEPV